LAKYKNENYHRRGRIERVGAVVTMSPEEILERGKERRKGVTKLGVRP